MMKPAKLIVVCSWYIALVAVPAGAQLVRQDTPAPAAAPSKAKELPLGKRRVSQEIQITGQQSWSDTGIDVETGEHIVVSASGQLRYADAKEDNGPEGIPRGFKDLLRILPLNGAGRGALIGRIGEADIAQPFLLGSGSNIVAPVAGRLAVGINQADDDGGEGTYTVHINVHAPDPGVAYHPARQVSAISGVDAKVFAKLPRRVSDKDNNAGDMVNFLIIGSEDAMQKVFTAAGWVKVDTDARASVLHGILGSISKESYLTMPMSPLYLFGRPQDYGWAHAEPIRVVASRNHLRVWKAPFEISGETLWVGAATHDIGFERDERNDGLTHKIDPNIDLERDYVEKTLSATGQVGEVTHALPANAIREARTATGGSFHSDGRILVLRLNELNGNISVQSPRSWADRFCRRGLLRYESPSQHTARLAPADVTLGGRGIRKRQAVIAMMGAGNRDPEGASSPHVRRSITLALAPEGSLCLCSARFPKRASSPRKNAGQKRGTGSCEEIGSGNFSGDSKCTPTSRSSLMRALNDKFLNADSVEIANVHFFTASRRNVSTSFL